LLEAVAMEVLILAIMDGCVRPIKSLYPPAAGRPTKTIHLVGHGWHTGVVLSTVDLEEAEWPVHRHFPKADYLEFGWGDAAYYPAERGTVWLAIKALCWPTPSVIHVAAIRGKITDTFPNSRLVQIELSEAGFERLCSFIQHEFQISATGELVPVGPGVFGKGQFYQARSKFYFPKTCNYWTASCLRSAGCPIRPLTSVTAGHVLSKTKKFGRPIRAEKMKGSFSIS